MASRLHRILREQACCNKSLIVGISGYGDQQAREKAHEAGFDHYLVKPIDIEALTQLILLSSSGVATGFGKVIARGFA